MIFVPCYLVVAGRTPEQRLAPMAVIILIHNHPRGDTAPSLEDISIACRLKEASEIIEMKARKSASTASSFFLSWGTAAMRTAAMNT